MSPSNDSDSSDASDSPLSTMDSHQLSRSGPKGDGGSPGRESLSPDDGSSSTTTPESHDSSSDSGDAMSVDDGPEGPGDEDSDDDADPQSAAQDGKREVGHSKGSAHGPQIRPVGFQAGSAGDLAGLLKMLNADGDEQLEGLKRFEKHARSALAQRNVGGGHGVTLIHAYFKGSPECNELFRVLAKGAGKGDKVRDSGKINALMRLLQALLGCHSVPLLIEHSRNLGTKIIRKANKTFIGAITSGKPRLFAESMKVLTQACLLGVVQARDAWKKFSPYLKTIVRYLEVMKIDDKSNKDGPRVERPFARQARTAVIEWGIALLRVGDAQLMAQVLGNSTLLPASIKHMASDPPYLIDKFLQVILDKVVSSRELSFPMRAALFSSFNLDVLTTLLRSHDTWQEQAGDEEEAEEEAAWDAAARGSVRAKLARVLAVFTCEVLSSETARAGAANAKLLLPMTLSLRPWEDRQQEELLLAVLRRHPPLQPAYLLASPLALTPAPSHKFLASAAVMGKVLGLMPGSERSGGSKGEGGGMEREVLLQALHLLPPQHASLPSHLAAASSISIMPPLSHAACSVLADWVAPPQMCKLTLGPGLQHASYLVRLSSANLLLLLLLRLRAAADALAAVAARHARVTQGAAGWEAAAVARTSSAAWRQAAAAVKRAVRGRLPDFQVLVAARQHAARKAVAGGGGKERGAQELQAELLLPRVLHLLARYIALFPESLAESRIDLPRLLPDPAATASPSALLQTLVLLRAAPPRTGAWLSPAKGVAAAAPEGSTTTAAASASEPACSYLGVLLRLTAEARVGGQGTAVVRVQAERLAETVMVECGLVGEEEEEEVGKEEARVWLAQVRGCRRRARWLDKLCVEAGLGRLHGLSLTGMAIGERHLTDAQGLNKHHTSLNTQPHHKGILLLHPCPPHVRAAMRVWNRAGSGSGGEEEGVRGGVSALLVCALEALKKQSGAGEEEERVVAEYVREVVAVLLLTSRRPTAVLAALYMLLPCQTAASGAEGSDAGCCSRKTTVGQGLVADAAKVLAFHSKHTSRGAGDEALSEESQALLGALLGSGGGDVVREVAWQAVGRGDGGRLLELLVRGLTYDASTLQPRGKGQVGGKRETEALQEPKVLAALEKLLHLLPPHVLLAQACMVGPTAMANGRILSRLQRGIIRDMAAPWQTRQLIAFGRQMLLHLTSLLIAHTQQQQQEEEEEEEPAAHASAGTPQQEGCRAGTAATAVMCQDLLRLLLLLLRVLWAQLLEASQGGSGGGGDAEHLCEDGNEGKGAGSGREDAVQQQWDALLEMTQVVLGNRALRCCWLAACDARGDGGGREASRGEQGGQELGLPAWPARLVALTVSHSLSHLIYFLLSRGWQGGGSTRELRAGGQGGAAGGAGGGEALRRLEEAGGWYIETLAAATKGHLSHLLALQGLSASVQATPAPSHSSASHSSCASVQATPASPTDPLERSSSRSSSKRQRRNAHADHHDDHAAKGGAASRKNHNEGSTGRTRGGRGSGVEEGACIGDLALAKLGMLHHFLAPQVAESLVLAILRLDLASSDKSLLPLLRRYGEVACEMIRGLNRRRLGLACRRSVKQLVAACTDMQSSSAACRLLLTLLASCVNPAVHAPCPLPHATPLQHHGDGGEGAENVWEANQDDVAILGLDKRAQADLMDALLDRSQHPSASCLHLQLCGMLARALPSVRHSLLRDLLADIPTAAPVQATQGGGAGRGSSKDKPKTHKRQRPEEEEGYAGEGSTGEERLAAMLEAVAQVVQSCRTAAQGDLLAVVHVRRLLGRPLIHLISSAGEGGGCVPRVQDAAIYLAMLLLAEERTLMHSRGDALADASKAAGARARVTMPGESQEQGEQGGVGEEQGGEGEEELLCDMAAAASSRLVLDLAPPPLTSMRTLPAGERRAEEAAADGLQEHRLAHVRELEFLVECIGWERGVAHTLFATRVLLRILTLLSAWYQRPLPAASAPAPLQQQQQQQQQQATAFVAADSFSGSRAGYAFKHGDKGLGYYRDASGDSGAHTDCEGAGDGCVEALEGLVVQVSRRILAGLVQVSEARDLFASSSKLVNFVLEIIISDRLRNPSSVFALQALLQLSASQALVACGCNLLANSAVKLHTLLLKHASFGAAVERGEGTRSAVLVAAVTCLHIGGGECCSPEVLVSYLAAYSATLADDDRLIRSAIHMLESHKLSPKLVDYAWGATAKTKAVSSSITSTSPAYAWLWSHTAAPSLRLQANIESFPLSMRVPSAPEGLSSSTIPPVFRFTPTLPSSFPRPRPHHTAATWTGEEEEGCGAEVASLLDPTYLLPAICGALASGSVHDVVMAMEGGGLAYAVMAAAAKHEPLRRLGYQVLELALQHVQEVDNKTSGVTRDWTSLGLLLKSLRDSITKPLQRLPLPIATFVSEGVLVVTRVGHPLFTPLTKFLVTRPFLDHAEVPMLYQLLNSGSGHCRGERWAMIRMLRCCARSHDDMDLGPLRKRHVPSMLMASFDSVASDASTRAGILKVLQHLAASPTAGVYLVEHAGVLSWLRLLLSSASVWQSPARPLLPEHNPRPSNPARPQDKSLQVAAAAEEEEEEVATVAEVEGVARVVLELARNLPAGARPALALEELALALAALLNRRIPARGSKGRRRAGGETLLYPSLSLVLDLLRCVLRRRAKRVGERVGGARDIACMVTVEQLVALLAEADANPQLPVGLAPECDTARDAMCDILVLTPPGWLTATGCDRASAAHHHHHHHHQDQQPPLAAPAHPHSNTLHLYHLASSLLRASWPAAAASGEARGAEGLGEAEEDAEGDRVARASGACSLLPDMLHPNALRTWEQARGEEERATRRCSKVLRWITALVAGHDALCDHVIMHARAAGGLLRAVLFLLRAPAAAAGRAALLAAINGLLAVITARAVLLSHQQAVGSLAPDCAAAVRATLEALGDCLADPSEMTSLHGGVHAVDGGASQEQQAAGAGKNLNEKQEALALLFRWAWSGQPLSQLRANVEDLAASAAHVQASAKAMADDDAAAVASPSQVLLHVLSTLES